MGCWIEGKVCGKREKSSFVVGVAPTMKKDVFH
jgi:hypothetical protein